MGMSSRAMDLVQAHILLLLLLPGELPLAGCRLYSGPVHPLGD